MTSQVTLDGFPLTGDTPAGGRARLVGSDGLDGWFNKALRRDRQEKAQQDGAWTSHGDAGSLPVVLRGQIVYADAAAAASERRRLLSLGGRDTSPLTVVDPLGSGTRMVEVDSLSVVPVRDSMLTFAFAVTAPDPLLYGPAVFAQTTLAASAGGTGRVWPRVWPRDWGVPPGVTPGAITLPNAGTASYFPQVRIDGPVSNPVVSLVETGDWVRYSGSIGAGQHVDINWGTPRRVTIGDNPVTARQRVTYSGNFLAVPVGGADMTWTADSFDDGHSLSAWGSEGAWE
jgi:hypothetical protein